MPSIQPVCPSAARSSRPCRRPAWTVTWPCRHLFFRLVQVTIIILDSVLVGSFKSLLPELILHSPFVTCAPSVTCVVAAATLTWSSPHCATRTDGCSWPARRIDPRRTRGVVSWCHSTQHRCFVCVSSGLMAIVVVDSSRCLFLQLLQLVRLAPIEPMFQLNLCLCHDYYCTLISPSVNVPFLKGSWTDSSSWSSSSSSEATGSVDLCEDLKIRF